MNSDLDASFRILGLSPGASWEEVKRAFRCLARNCHPDVAGPSATMEFQRIASAYMTIREEAQALGICQRGGSPQKRSTPRSSSQTWESSGKRRLWTKMAESWERWRAYHHERENMRQEARAREVRAREEALAARDRRIDSLLTETEKLLKEIGEAAIPVAKDQGYEGELLRLRSDLPTVRSLAVEALRSRFQETPVQEAILEMLSRCTEEEFLHFLSRRIPESFKKKVCPLAASRGAGFSELGGLRVMRWLSLVKDRQEFFGPLLRHPSGVVRGKVLRLWPSYAPLPEGVLLRNLLQSSEEEVLIPLLRMLRYTSLPAWVFMKVQKIAQEHASPMVRVWAKTLVSKAPPVYNDKVCSKE